MVSWIPSKLAIVGQVVDLKEPDGTWARGWKVDKVYGEKEKSLLTSEQQVWRHWKAKADG